MTLEGYLNETQCAKLLKNTVRTLRNWRAKGIGPAYTRVGQKVHYRVEAINEWLLANEVTPVRAKGRR